MNFDGLIAGLPEKKGAIYVLERGKVVRHSYAALAQQVDTAQAALVRWGVKAGDRVGIYAPNSVHWLVYDLALIALRAVSVPFTEDFAGKVDDALLERYNIALLLTAKAHAKHFAPGASHIAFIDGDNGAVRALDRPPCGGDDVADQLTLAFSSGSAGGLKGLVISRSGVEATLPPITDAIGITPSDRLMVFLPMSNFQQRTLCYAGLDRDFALILTDYAQLFAAIKTLHPTILIGPPMYYQMAHTRFANFPAAKRWWWTVLGRTLSLIPGAGLRRSLARRLFPEFHQPFGAAMRRLVTGMAPSKRNVSQFYELMQLPLCESYGLVETGSLTFRQSGSGRYDSVGKPLRGVAIDLAEDGEVIVRRDKFLTLRYFQCAEGENERTFIGGGRVATGDIGRMDAEGYLYLLGRKKELIVTSGGYKIHPEIIEAELNFCPDVAQSVVFAKPGVSHLVAVVVLLHPGAEAEARVKKFAAEMSGARKVAPIGEILFSAETFSTQNGMLRPNLKLDRRAIAAKFQI